MAIAYPVMLFLIVGEGIFLLIGIASQSNRKGESERSPTATSRRCLQFEIALAFLPIIYFGRLSFEFGRSPYVWLLAASLVIPICHALALALRREVWDDNDLQAFAPESNRLYAAGR